MPRLRFPFIIMVLTPGAVLPVAAQRRPAPPARSTAPALPAIPRANGPLAIRIAYPQANALIAARDSNFIFGQVGNGDATLAINGYAVPVAPNGTFLAWLPLLGDSAEVYFIVARLGADSVALEHRVRRPRRFVPPPGLWLDPASLEPRGSRWVEPGELLRVAVRATPGATVTLTLPDSTVIPLPPDTVSLSLSSGPFDRRPPGAVISEVTRYAGSFVAVPLGAPLPPPVGLPPPCCAPRDSTARTDSALITVTLGPDTVRARLPLRVALLDPARRTVVVLDDDTARAGNTDGAVSGKPLPDGTFEWFFRNGTPAAVSGRAGDHVRVALSRLTSVWVAAADVAGALAEGTPPPWSRVSLVRLAPGESSIVARVALAARVPYRVEETDRALTLRLYGARADLDWLQYGGTDPLVTRMSWAQATDDEVTVTFELSRPVFGYRVAWQGTDLMLEIRKPPAIDRNRPLRGRLIAIDPGHPPQGAPGPGGFHEREANLAVALELRTLLERAGARVIMTRTTDTAIGLYERTNLAEQQGAELLVSIHNNAFPDGVNPFENNGTSTYYFQPRAARLAALVQDAMLRRMGLRNLGFGRGDLALVRPTWLPAVLTEGAFMMIPEQENALRTPAFQQRYARGVLEGLEAYLREIAAP